MKKSLLAIVFAAAALPIFAAQNAPASGQSTNQSTTAPAKKAKKHSTKKTSPTTTTSTTSQK